MLVAIATATAAHAELGACTPELGAFGVQRVDEHVARVADVEDRRAVASRSSVARAGAMRRRRARR
jgi:hypothetical protein